MASVTEELLQGKTSKQEPRSSVTEELLRGQRDISGEVEYLSGVLSDRIQTPDADTKRALERQARGGVLLSDLPLANYNPYDDKWSPKGTVDFATRVKAETVDDPATKLKIYASTLFPDDPDAVGRFGMVEGVPIYLADDGKLYRATRGGFIGEAKQFAAATTARSPSMIMGGLGGVGAGGPVGAVGGAVVGAMGGEGIRKVVGNLAFDEPQTSAGNLWEMTKEGLLAGGGALLGLGLAKWINRNAVKDIGRQNVPETQRLEALSRRYRFPLTPAEKTNLPSLRAQQKAVGNLQASADTVDEFLKGRYERGQGMMDEFLNTLSPEDSIEQAGRRVREASLETMERYAKQRANAAAPVYQRAFTESKEVPQGYIAEANELMRRPAMIQAARRAVQLARNEGLDLGDPRQSLRGMHYMKLSLDSLIGEGERKGMAAAERRALLQLKDRLVSIMDDISPKDEQGRSLYGLARSIYAHSSPGVEQIREGLLGRIAQVAPDAEITIPKKLLDAESKGPIAVSRAMKELRQTDPEAANQALRAFLQQKWNEASKEYVSRSGYGAKAMQGARVRAMLIGDRTQRDILNGAMTGEQWRAFSDLMDLFEASGRAPMVGSDTAWNLEMQREMRKGGVLGKIAQALSPQDVGSKVSEWLKTRGMQDYARRTAEIITSPENLALMKELRRLPSTSQKRLVITGALLGIGSEAMAGDDSDLPLGATKASERHQ